MRVSLFPALNIAAPHRPQARAVALQTHEDTFVRFGQGQKPFEKKLAEGSRAFLANDFKTAYRAYLGAREWSDPDNLNETVQSLHSLGVTCKYLKAFEEGERHLNEGIRLVETQMQEGKDRDLSLAGLQNDLGQLYYENGQSALAEELLEASYANTLKGYNNATLELPFDAIHWAEANQTLGYIAEHLGNYEKAIPHYEAALAFQEQHNIKPSEQFHNLTMLARFYFYESRNYTRGSSHYETLSQKQEQYLAKAESKVEELISRFPSGHEISVRLAELNETLMLVGRTGRYGAAS